MDDEAIIYYNVIIDEYFLGLEFLRQNFENCGRFRVVWQIDLFGYFREQVFLFVYVSYE